MMNGNSVQPVAASSSFTSSLASSRKKLIAGRSRCTSGLDDIIVVSTRSTAMSLGAENSDGEDTRFGSPLFLPPDEEAESLGRIVNPLYSPGSFNETATPKTEVPEGDQRAPSYKRTTCLLCSDPVLINVNNELRDTMNGERQNPVLRNKHENVKILCFQLNFSPEDIPHNLYSDEMFPFCPTCESLVEQISGSHRRILKEKQKLANYIAAVERTIADAELIKPSDVTDSSLSGSDEKKFMRLREVVLNEYRQKLLKKRQLRENLISNTEPNSDNDTGEPITNNGFDETLVNGHVDENGGYEVDETFGNVIITNGSSVNSSRKRGTAIAQSSGPEVVVSGPSTDCPVDVEGGTMEVEDFLETIIKQQPISRSSSPIDTLFDVDNTEDEEVTSSKRKRKNRRSVIGGVDVYETVHGSESNRVLGCGACGFRVPLEPNGADRYNHTAHETMKNHIVEVHFKKSKRLPRSPDRPVPESSNSEGTNQKARASASEEIAIDCDVCGRPCNMRNVWHHKFSHKNLMEKAVAIQGDEKGAPSRKGHAAKTILQMWRKTEVDNQELYGNRERPNGRSMKCKICSKRFSSSTLLLKHVQGHKS